MRRGENEKLHTNSQFSSKNVFEIGITKEAFSSALVPDKSCSLSGEMFFGFICYGRRGTQSGAMIM